MNGYIYKNDQVLVYKKNSELLLVDCEKPRPLYIPKGAEHVLKFLNKADEISEYKKIVAKYPNDIPMLEMLLDHGIILKKGQEKISEISKSVENGPSFELEIANHSETCELNTFKSFGLYLLLAQYCNQSCIYCYNGEATYETLAKKKMPDETAFRAVDFFLSRLDPGGFFKVVFFGGEPLLNWPLVKKTIQYVESCLKKHPKQIKVHYHITTNLTLFPDDLIDWAKKYNISFNIDIDGPREIHDVTRPLIGGESSYDLTTRNVEKLRKAGIKFHLQAVVTVYNQDSLLEVARLHKEMGASSCALVPVLPVLSDEYMLGNDILPNPEKVALELARVIEEGIWEIERFSTASRYLRVSKPVKYSRWWCNALIGKIPVVDVNGDIYLDSNLVGLQRYRLGNVFNGREKYPDAGICEQVISHLKEQVDLMCVDCPIRNLCPGGCPLGPIQILDNPRADQKIREYFKTMTCGLSSKMVEAVLWQKAKITTHSARDKWNGSQNGSQSIFDSCTDIQL